MDSNLKSFNIIFFSFNFFLVLLVVQPLDPNAVLPNALTGHLLLPVDSSAVLLSVLPLSLVKTAISESKNSEAMLLIVLIGTFVAAPVRPSENPFAMHLIVVPLAIEDSSILPHIFALPVNVVL